MTSERRYDGLIEKHIMMMMMMMMMLTCIIPADGGWQILYDRCTLNYLSCLCLKHFRKEYHDWMIGAIVWENANG